MKKNNILYISSEASMGGASQSLIDMLLAVNEFVNPIVVLPESGTLSNKLDELGIKYYKLRLSRGYGKIGQHNIEDEKRDFVINYLAGLEIKKIIEKEQIVLVHINSSVCNAGAIGAILAEKPYIWHIRELPELQFNSEYWDLQLKLKLYKNAYGIIAISDTVSKDFFNRYGLKAHVIYDGINESIYYKNIDNVIPNRNIVVAGNMNEAKGQIDAIKAVKILVDKGMRDVHLYLVGNNSKRFRWCLDKFKTKYKLEKNITIESFKADLSDLRQKCFYSLTTSKYEALGRVTVEAMYAGNFVIGANTAGTKEIIGDNQERGILYSCGNENDLAYKIELAMKLNDEYKYMIRKNAQEYALRLFGLSNYGSKMNEYYNKILSCTNTNTSILDYINMRYKKESSIDLNKDMVNKTAIIKDIEAFMDKNKKAIEEKMNSILTGSIAIYGMGALGCKLYDELISLGKKEIYAIDRETFFVNEFVKVYLPNEKIPRIDYLIITVVGDGSKIKKQYEYLKTTNIVTIEELCDYKKEGEGQS